MKYIRQINSVTMTIGILSMCAGFYLVHAGAEFLDCFFSVFVGVVLLGTGYFDQQSWKGRM